MGESSVPHLFVCWHFVIGTSKSWVGVNQEQSYQASIRWLITPYQAAFLSDFIANCYYLHGHSYRMGKTYIVSLGRDHTSLMMQESEPEGDNQEAALSSGKKSCCIWNT